MITITELSKYYGRQTLFENVDLQLNSGCRYGVVGANGSGKSTLLRILSEQEEQSGGQVAMPKRAIIGVLEQDHFQYEAEPIIEVAMRGNVELWHAMNEKERLIHQDHYDLDKYAELEDTVLRLDGYAYEARCGEILEGLGIPTPRHRDALSTLSGGYKLRVLMAKMLAAEPDILLLDEPTNHLDIVSIAWLEKFLESFSGCAVVVSHDHRFLDRVVTHILDVDYETITGYTGNYQRFVDSKTEERGRRESENAKREKEIADHMAYVERFRAKATKARQAQSKLRAANKIEVNDLAQSSRRYPRFGFPQRRSSGKQVLEIEGISKAYGDNVVLEGVDTIIRRGERVGIIGPNGIGKSTLLKIVTGGVDADEGSVEWGYEAQIGYFPQDHTEIFGGVTDTIEGWFGAQCSGENIGQVRGRLAKVLFSGDEVKKKIEALSGGEATRLIFCRIALEQPNVMILDEPTNHLDLEAIEALANALEAYEGTLIFVSHDRWFVERLATRIIEITEAGVNDVAGGWEDYLALAGEDHLDVDEVSLKAKRKKTRPKAAAKSVSVNSGERKKLEKRKVKAVRERDRLTAAIDKAEARIDAIDAIFCEEGFFESTPRPKIEALETEQAAARALVDESMKTWERLERELNRIGEALDG